MKANQLNAGGKMESFLILYFSGVGNTKAVADAISKYAKNRVKVDLYSIEKLPKNFNVENYSAVVLGSPTYHSEPALPMIKFLESLNLKKKIPAFLFTTCGLYPENCLRIFAKTCQNHKIIPIHTVSYRCPATDGILLTPFMNCWFKSEKNIEQKIKNDFDLFYNALKSSYCVTIPKAKWYTPLNYPNKMLGKATTFSIHLHKEQCIKCGKCKRDCPQGAIDMKDYPQVIKESCINCYRCIHHCPVMALSLSKRKPIQKVWKNSL